MVYFDEYAKRSMRLEGTFITKLNGKTLRPTELRASECVMVCCCSNTTTTTTSKLQPPAQNGQQQQP